MKTVEGGRGGEGKKKLRGYIKEKGEGKEQKKRKKKTCEGNSFC